jgi:transcriptional regulator with XRE-family HTH domain
MATKTSAVNIGMSRAIRAERSARGITIDELSERSSIPKATLNRLLAKHEKDLRDINVTQMVQIAKALGMSPEDLVAEAERRAPLPSDEESSDNASVIEQPKGKADDLATARRRRAQKEAAEMSVEQIESLAEAAARRHEPEIDEDLGEDD